MNDLEWRDEYSIGMPAIDFQHRAIFETLLSIAQGSTNDDGLRAEAEIVRLVGLLREHFSLEESMMRTLYYPGLDLHIAEHRQFQADVLELAENCLRKTGTVPRESLKLAHTWLRQHILTSDMHYLDFFSNPTHESGSRVKIVK